MEDIAYKCTANQTAYICMVMLIDKSKITMKISCW